jgi:hypothetical protein
LNDFLFWLKIGVEHIADLKAYDHILFLLVLFIPFELSGWKSLLLLVTAFTIGHSITLITSTLKIFSFPTELVEFFIPLTILATCIQNLRKLNSDSIKVNPMTYLIVLSFGFIHGMGFSVLLRSLLGSEESIILPLLSFNIGIELGQILILAVFYVLYYLFRRIFSFNPYNIRFFVSSAVWGIAFVMAAERLFLLLNA